MTTAAPRGQGVCGNQFIGHTDADAQAIEFGADASALVRCAPIEGLRACRGQEGCHQPRKARRCRLATNSELQLRAGDGGYAPIGLVELAQLGG